MKEISKALTRAKLPVIRKGDKSEISRPKEPEINTPTASGMIGPSGSPFVPLDSWSPAARANQQREDNAKRLKPSDARASNHSNQPSEETVDPLPDVLPRWGRPTTPAHKRRNVVLTMSVSPEEAEILRRHAYSLGLNYSEWARVTLFSAMDRRIPARPGQKVRGEEKD